MVIYSYVTEQGYILWIMFLIGIVLGIAYDVIRTIRTLHRISDRAAAVEDVIYWIAAAFVVWYVQNCRMEGQIRFCQFFTGAAGMMLYYALCSRILRKILYVPLAFVCGVAAEISGIVQKGGRFLQTFVGKWNKQKEKDQV